MSVEDVVTVSNSGGTIVVTTLPSDSAGSTITVKSLTDDSKIIQVQEGTLPGPKGDSPDKSIYAARTIIVTDPNLVLDASTATTFYLKLQSSVALTISNWPNDSKSQRIAIYIEQDQVGNRRITWPAGTKWSYGQIPPLSSSPSAIDCIVLDTFNGGVTIFGGVVGVGYN